MNIHSRRWRRVRAYILDRDAWTCRVPVDADGRAAEVGPECGVHLQSERILDPDAAQVDHIIDRALGGSDEPSNLRAACRLHNLQRSAQHTNAGRLLPALNLSREW